MGKSGRHFRNASDRTVSYCGNGNSCDEREKMCIRDRYQPYMVTELSLAPGECVYGLGAVSYTHLDMYKRQ